MNSCYDAAPSEDIQQAVASYLAQVTAPDEVRLYRCAAALNLPSSTLWKSLPEGKWTGIRHAWLREHIERALDEVFSTCITREAFTMTRVRDRTRVRYQEFKSLAHDEWSSRSASLRPAQEIVLERLAEARKSRTSYTQLTFSWLCRELDHIPVYGPWVSVPLRAARLELSAHQRGQHDQPAMEPDEDNATSAWDDSITGSIIEESEIRFKGQLLRRDRLRPDIADVAWSSLREAIATGELSPRTVGSHYYGYILAGRVLGADVPDIRAAKLEAIQSAWLKTNGLTNSTLPKCRGAMTRLFRALLAAENTAPDHNEIRRICVWLTSHVTVRNVRTLKDSLSEDELDQVAACCISDIRAGVEFVSATPDICALSTRSTAASNAAPVVRWGVALTILTMMYAALRSLSIGRLTTGDLLSIDHNVAAILWSHPKKREESVTMTSIVVRQLVDHYVSLTGSVREVINTKSLFLVGDQRGDWTGIESKAILCQQLAQFVNRHGLMRGDSPLTLTPTVLRRTYVTHQLRKGRSIWFVRAQLNHTSVSTTRAYGQFGRYEHPEHTCGPLDDWGRESLDLWHKPVVLENLDHSARAKLFSLISEEADHRRDVDDPVPCSTCELLLAEPGAHQAWEIDRERREQQIRRLEESGADEATLATARSDHELFIRNYRRCMEGASDE